MEPEQLFHQNLDLIHEVCTGVCRRNNCFPPDSEDFTSQVRIALMENDFARLRSFGGRSRLKTFLTTVVVHLFLDHRNKAWGRWRPSRAAVALGDVACLLDRLLHRDGLTFDEAAATLRTNHRIDISEAELRRMAEKLPARAPRRFESDGDLEHLPAATDPERDLLDSEHAHRADEAHRALARVLGELEPKRRLLLKLRFQKGLTVTQIAKIQGRERRRLYTELDKLLRDLRRRLEEDGFRADEILNLEGWAQ